MTGVRVVLKKMVAENRVYYVLAAYMLALTQQSCYQPPFWSGEGVDAGGHIEFEAAVWVDVSPEQRGKGMEVACC